MFTEYILIPALRCRAMSRYSRSIAACLECVRSSMLVLSACGSLNCTETTSILRHEVRIRALWCTGRTRRDLEGLVGTSAHGLFAQAYQQASASNLSFVIQDIFPPNSGCLEIDPSCQQVKLKMWWPASLIVQANACNPPMLPLELEAQRPEFS